MKQPSKPAVTCETRYRHKLNMLEPGTAMLKWVGIFLMLMILLIVDAHQDRVLNELAARENRK